MWTIPELKARALAAFKANYWPCVGVALIAALVSGGGSCSFHQKLGSSPSSSGVREENSEVSQYSQDSVSEQAEAADIDFAPADDDLADEPSAEAAPDDSAAPQTFWGFLRQLKPGGDAKISVVLIVVLAVFVAVVVVVALLLRILLLNPLSAGCCGFFLRNATAKTEFAVIGAPFRDWKRFVKTMFLRDLFLFLWCLPGLFVWLWLLLWLIFWGTGTRFTSPVLPSLLGMVIFAWVLMIPVLVKTYSYRLVPYLLSDDPALSGCAAIDRSRALMDGHKFHAFLLDLSFVGWFFLSVLTCGILFIFYVNPYFRSTQAALYRALAYPATPPPLPNDVPPHIPS